MPASDLIPVIRQALPAGYSVRERQDADMRFLRELYAQSREGELRPVPWSPERKQAFLADQFAKQHAYYLAHYLDALWGVITHEEQPVGRVYVSAMAGEQRLMDICLANGFRNRGLGTAVIGALLREADRAGLEASLHVEPYNPALRLYARLGYEPVEMRGIYQFMRRERRAGLVEDQLVAHRIAGAGDGHQEQVEPAVSGVQ